MYEKIKLESLIQVENVYTIHYFKYAKNFSYKGETHNFWELVYVDSGEVGVTADTKKYALGQGEMIFHKPNEYHNIWAANKFANVVIISFDCLSPAMTFFENKILSLSQKLTKLLSDIVSEAKSTFVEPLDIVELTCMSENEEAPFGSKQIIRMRLEELLIQLIRINRSIRPKERLVSRARENRDQELAESVTQYLKENINKALTLDMLSLHFSFGKTHLKKIFKSVTGTSIIDCFISMKIDEAKRMLSEHEYNITEIAELLSFNSVHYFSRCFKNRTNMTPTEYARSVQSKNVL